MILETMHKYIEKKKNTKGIISIIIILFFFLGVTPSGNCLFPLPSLPKGDIIWDNYEPPYMFSDSILSQQDKVYPFNAQAADDFMFESDMQIDGVQWWGVFNSGTPPWPNPMPFNIIFYADDGTGTMPTGAGMDDPTQTALAVYHFDGVDGQLYGLDDEYGVYNVTLSTPFNATANTKYWIAIQADHVWPPLWDWRTNAENPDQLHVAMRGFPICYVQYWTNAEYGDMAFNLRGELWPTPKPDLDCAGELVWNDIKPGATVHSSFNILNIGEPGSHLNWTIASYPDWGTWSFSPSSGTNLAPENGSLMVTVQVTVPKEKNENFTGQVIVMNTDNSSDYCVVPVSLSTPINENIGYHFVLERILDRFPNAFPMLRFLLEYLQD